MTDAIVIYVCCVDAEQAQHIGKLAVQARLAACANIIPGMQSIYEWQGKLEEGRETILLLKTQAKHFDACAALVKANHSYELPCIVALPIAHGTPDFLAWIEAQTAGA